MSIFFLFTWGKINIFLFDVLRLIGMIWHERILETKRNSYCNDYSCPCRALGVYMSSGLFNIDVGGLGKSISETVTAAIKKGENLATIQKEVEGQLQGFLTEINKGQTELNKIEAQSTSLFKSGWRPALAWVAVFGFIWGFVLYPITTFVLKLLEIKSDLPAINSDGLFELVLALLGMAGIRTFEKKNNITK